MLKLTEEERTRLVARKKITDIRDGLKEDGDVMNNNPFLNHAATAESLSRLFTDFARQVEKAAQDLSAVTGVKAPVLADGKKCDYLAAGYVADSLIKKTVLEMPLCEGFIAAASDPFFGLQQLERDAGKSGTYDTDIVQKTLDGLAGLYRFSKAVPLVYEQISQGAEPAPAVV